MTGIEVWLARAVNRITGSTLGTYQSAVIRIGFSATWLLFLLREFPHRQELYGPDGPWSWSMAQRLVADNGAFTALIWTDSQVWFEIVYALAMVSSVLLLLGWRTRTVSVLFMIGVLSLENRSIFMSDGGDNVLHLMSIYLVLTRCGAVWSLDARRERLNRQARARGARERADVVGPLLWGVLGLALIVVGFEGLLSSGWSLIFWGLWLVHGLWWAVDRTARQDALRAGRDGEYRAGADAGVGGGVVGVAGVATPASAAAPAGAASGPVREVRSGPEARNQARLLLDVIANLAHHAGLLVIMVEACLIYSTAGWYKIQGSRWEDGTAVYYPLHLDYFSPWPALSEALGSHGLVVLVITYGTVMVQVAFPFALFNRRVKNVLLVAMICEHAVIAVTLGLPFFSLAMIAADSVFLPTGFLLWIGSLALRVRGGLRPGARGAKPGGQADQDNGTDPERPAYPDESAYPDDSADRAPGHAPEAPLSPADSRL